MLIEAGAVFEQLVGNDDVDADILQIGLRNPDIGKEGETIESSCCMVDLLHWMERPGFFLNSSN